LFQKTTWKRSSRKRRDKKGNFYSSEKKRPQGLARLGGKKNKKKEQYIADVHNGWGSQEGDNPDARPRKWSILDTRRNMLNKACKLGVTVSMLGREGTEGVRKGVNGGEKWDQLGVKVGKAK